MMTRTVAHTSAQPEWTIVVAATFTAEPLEESISFWRDELGIDAAVEFAPFGQVFQELLDRGSLTNRNDRGLNVILVRPEDWLRPVSETRSDEFGGSEAFFSKTVSEFVSALEQAAERASVPFLVCLCHDKPMRQANLESSRRFSGLVDRLASEIQSIPGVMIHTPADLDTMYPVPEYYDAEQDELACIPYTELYYVSLATLIARKLYSVISPDIKVIVLDCDNTLWKGICGEDGAHGVDVDFASRALQKFMIEQYEDGVLLGICSKNNEQDVNDVFDMQSDMPLSLDHFVAKRVNWKPKSENLVSMSEELGLGLDSFVFIDDDPVECDEVRTRCPSVVTLQLPRQRPLIPDFLKHAWVFDRSEVSDEARVRSDFYRRNTMRKSAEAESASLEDFLSKLDLTVEIVEMDAGNIPRVAELFNRTNQFNATTIRYTEGDIRSLFNGKSVTFLTATAKDRFGDYGLIGVCVYSIDSLQVKVDSLLLSCRALGRRIEHLVLARLAEIGHSAGCAGLNITYRETEKNHLVREFLESIEAGRAVEMSGGLEYNFPIQPLLNLQG